MKKVNGSFGFSMSIATCSVLMSELWAFHDALQHAKSLGLRKIEIEMDNGEAIRVVQGRVDVDDSPSSPLYGIQNLTVEERTERWIHVSNARANYLNLISSSDTSKLPDNIRIPLLRENLWYAAEFTIGSQGHRVKLLMDTGGGLIWTQCQPCQNCFPQRLPVYDPRLSNTYATLPCEHRLCKTPGKDLACIDGVCRYTVNYGGGTSTKGVLSTESFHFLIDKTNNGILMPCLVALTIAAKYFSRTLRFQVYLE
ncbi:aspartic proteinase nepenthesin-2-like [Hibiscus syriacus]|uniref:aspartic proteinase nepenthesin-2-like n=1 Tax=Hibiscus syriacus TaxID=106335 RepID=UPI0019220502|nr:aspartic proteinase nepenthesin-2-like [Hibiscus syriacus]